MLGVDSHQQLYFIKCEPINENLPTEEYMKAISLKIISNYKRLHSYIIYVVEDKRCVTLSWRRYVVLE